MQKHTNLFRLRAFDLPLALFLASALFGLLPAYDRSLAWTPLAAMLLGGALYFAVARLAFDEGRARILSLGLVVAGGLAGVYFATQSAHYQTEAKVETVFRLAKWLGTLFPSLVIWQPDGNSLATLLEGMLFLAGGLFLTEKQHRLRLVEGLAGGAIVLGLVVSESRGAWLAVAAGGLIWLALHQRWGRWLAAALGLGLLGLVGVVLLSGELQVLNRIPLINTTLAPLLMRPDRLALYQGGISLIQDQPFSGIGLGLQFGMIYSRYVLVLSVPYLYYAHNLFLEAWLEQGLVGFFALLWLVFSVVFWAKRLRTAGIRDLFSESAWIGLGVVFLHGLTDARQYFMWWSWLPFFVLFGLFQGQILRNQAQEPGLGQRSWLPLAAAGVLLTVFLVILPVRSGSLQANLGAVQQAWADLSPGLQETEKTHLLGEAEKNLQASITVSPLQRSAHLRLGMILLEEEHFTEAVEQLQAALQADPHHPTVLKELGYAYVWAGRLENARNVLQQVPNIIAELNYFAWWRTTRQQNSLAKYAWQVSLLLSPDQPDVRKSLESLQAAP